MINAKIGTKEINIPTKWEDITLGQLMCLNANRKHIDIDPVMLISCLTTPTDQPGTAADPESTYGLWFRSSVDQMNRIILPAISFSHDNFDFTTQPVPKSLMIREKECIIPDDISLASYGQLQLLTSEINKRGSIAAAPYAIAFYLQPQVSGEFNYQSAIELIPEILLLPAIKAFPVADFFLSSCKALVKNSTNGVTKN